MADLFSQFSLDGQPSVDEDGQTSSDEGDGSNEVRRHYTFMILYSAPFCCPRTAALSRMQTALALVAMTWSGL